MVRAKISERQRTSKVSIRYSTHFASEEGGHARDFRCWTWNFKAGLGRSAVDFAEKAWTWPKTAGLDPKRLDLTQNAWT